MSGESIAATIAAISKRRPALAPILKALEPLLEARQRVAARLAPVLAKANISLPPFSREKAAHRDYLLSYEPLQGLDPFLKQAASELLPLLCKFAHAEANTLAQFWLHMDKRLAARLVRATLAEPDELAKIAEENELDPGLLHFTAGQIVSAVLRALMLPLAAGPLPWDEPGAWQQSYCPVCGSYPTIAWLDKARLDEKNAFLAGGGGKKHFYCDMCSANWTYRRGICPACGKEGKGAVEILHEAIGRGERLDYCASCGVYCPTIDLRELGSVPNLDAIAPGMLHLDMVAAERNLQPMKPSLWNNFQNPA